MYRVIIVMVPEVTPWDSGPAKNAVELVMLSKITRKLCKRCWRESTTTHWCGGPVCQSCFRDTSTIFNMKLRQPGRSVMIIIETNPFTSGGRMYPKEAFNNAIKVRIKVK